MTYYAKKDEALRQDSGNGHWSYPLLNETNGCVNDCMTGISVYASTTYTPPAVHPFQEGFLVIRGTGWAKVGEEEFPLVPELSFLVPAGCAHALKSDSEQVQLELFWFHAGA